MKQIKFLLVVCAILMTTFFGFSQEKYKHVGFTDSDIKNYIKNLENIKQDVDKLGTDINSSSTVANLALYNDKTILNKLNGICNKHGISGGNALEKFLMISTYAPIVVAQYMVDSDPQVAIQFAAIGVDPIATYRGLIDEADYLVIYKHASDLKKLFSDSDEE